MFGFNKKPKNYTTKKGYVVPHDGGDLIPAMLYAYNNGIFIVETLTYDRYEATYKDGVEYKVNHWQRERFIVTE